MNENKWIDNPKITIEECVGADSQDGKMCWIIINEWMKINELTIPK